MAVEYKTTTTTKLKNRISGFAYSVVPTGNNIAGITWKVALTEFLTVDRVDGTTSVAPTLPAAVTQVQLDAGDFVEWPFSIEVNADLTDVNKETVVQAQLLVEEVEVLAELQSQLNFWGREGQAV